METFRADLRRYRAVHRVSVALLPLRAPSLLAVAVHRYGSWARRGRRPLHRLLHAVLFELIRRVTRVHIAPWAEIGGGVWFGAGGPIFAGASLGENVTVHAGVTLGAGGVGAARGVPSIGDGCVLGPGASITGGVRVPAGTVVGPNSVVSRSLPHGGAWLGIPARPFRGPTLVPDLGEP